MRAAQKISTIVTPATSYNLVDLATLKVLMGITGTASDAFLTLLIPMASGAAQRFCNNPFAVETVQDQIWPSRDGWPHTMVEDINVLQLSRWPIVNVVSVVETIAGTATTLTLGTDFLADNVNGQLIRLDLFGKPRDWRPNPVVVNYSAGYATIPPDVVDAVATLIKARFYSQGRDPSIRSRNVVGVMETSYWFGQGPGTETDLTPDVEAKLARYSVPVLA